MKNMPAANPRRGPKSAADRGAARGAAEEDALVAHLCLGRVTEWCYSAKHDADLGVGLESGNRGGIMTLRHKIVVIEEVNEPAAGQGPAEIAHHARKAASRLRVPKVTH